MRVVSSISRPVLLIGRRLVGWFLRLVLSSFVQYIVLSSEKKSSIPSLMQPLGGESRWGTRRSKAIDSNIRGVIPVSQSSTQAALLTCGARGENRAHEVLHLLLHSRPLGYSCGVARCCFLCPLVHPEVLAPVQSRIPSLSVLKWSRALTFGYGCTVYVGVGVAGDAEVDVIYISFIVSVQYIGYLIPYRDKVQVDNN